MSYTYIHVHVRTYMSMYSVCVHSVDKLLINYISVCRYMYMDTPVNTCECYYVRDKGSGPSVQVVFTVT